MSKPNSVPLSPLFGAPAPGTKLNIFVVMPFGKKRAILGGDKGTKRTRSVDFDDIYKRLIQPLEHDLRQALPFTAEVQVRQSRDYSRSGDVLKGVYEHLRTADVVIADLSLNNANVFYELGVRHALRSGVTILINGPWTMPVFDIQNQKHVAYSLGTPAELEKARAEIVAHILEGLRSGRADSPMATLLHLEEPDYSEVIPVMRKLAEPVGRKGGACIGLVTGELGGVRGIDAWVNSENTNMQMARFYDRSISGTIRYHGATRDVDRSAIKEDTIASELAVKVGPRPTVPPLVEPGYVASTTAGGIPPDWGVKRLFHVAVVKGIGVGQGYALVPDLRHCVLNVLNAANACREADIRSILIPLFGTGTGGAKLQHNAQTILSAAMDWLRGHGRDGRPPRIQEVYVLTRTETQFRVCSTTLQRLLKGAS